jgi:predicted transcriptional regulator
MENENTVVDFREHPFIMVTKEVIDNDSLLMKPVDLAVYVVLCMYADNRTKASNPKVETIAKKARCSERVARRSIRNLEEAGYIKVKPRYDARGHQSSNQYILTDYRK